MHQISGHPEEGEWIRYEIKEEAVEEYHGQVTYPEKPDAVFLQRVEETMFRPEAQRQPTEAEVMEDERKRDPSF